MVTRRTALACLLLITAACDAKDAGNNHKPPRPAIGAAALPAPNAVRACVHPDSQALSPRHRRILAAMFATDKNRGRTTFGFAPPDTSQIRLLSDQNTCIRANAAFESVLSKASEKSNKSYPKANLYVYRAGNLYAVLYPDWQSSADISDQFMFFDSRWNYLGDRAQ